MSGRDAVCEKKFMLPRRRLSHTGGWVRSVTETEFRVGFVGDFGNINGWPSVVNTHGSSPLCSG